MMLKEPVSDSVVRRLPRYYRYLSELERAGVERTSSQALATQLGSTASQIRQDLNCFGDFGQQGYGYNVKELYSQIGSILGLDRGYEAALVGAGNIGQAVSNYSRFENLGVKITAIFDANPKLIGMKIRNVEIMDIDDMESVLHEHKIDIGIICVPRKNAQSVADELIKGGIRAIWNFAPVDLIVPDYVKVENVHLSESLMTLIYLLNESDN